MTIALICPSCGNLVTAPDSAAGCIGKCAKCGGAVKVPAPVKKVCVACGKDVSGAKRVKDDAGRYYCQPCFVDAHKPVAAGTVAGMEVPAPAGGFGAVAQIDPTPVSDEIPLIEEPERTPRQRAGYDDDLPLKDDIPIKAEVTSPAARYDDDLALKDDPAPRPAPRSPAADRTGLPSVSGPLNLPDACPNCGVPVFKKDSRLCVKCGRDLTQMDTLRRIKADAARGPSREEKAGQWVALAVKLGLWGGLAAALVLGAWLVYTMFNMPNPFPTTRVQAVKDFLAFVEKGDEKSLEKAWGLVSIIHKNPDHRDVYLARFRKMSEDFRAKYGPGWNAKAVVDPPRGKEVSHGETLLVHIDKDAYYIVVDPQLALEAVITDMASKNTRTEDGKLGFGVADVEFYEFEPPKERFGRQSPSEPVGGLRFAPKAVGGAKVPGAGGKGAAADEDEEGE
jgi:hypothetical protein